MNICKYCGNPIEGEPVMNPDKDGNGYHHFCLVDKEFRDGQKSIFDRGYNKGKTDALKELRTKVAGYENFILCANGQTGVHTDVVLGWIDEMLMKEVNDANIS